MRLLSLIPLAIALSASGGTMLGQSSSQRSESSSTLSTSPADFSEDQTFSRFERVTTGMKPPKATYAPDPKFPDLPADAERHGVVVMLVGVNTKGHVKRCAFSAATSRPSKRARSRP